MRNGVLKKALALFMILTLMVLQMPDLHPHVHAGHVCPECNEWIDDGDYCQHCFRCMDCCMKVGWCDVCDICIECAVTLDDTSTWTLTADTWITAFNGDTANVVTNGYTLYVNGTALEGTD